MKKVKNLKAAYLACSALNRTAVVCLSLNLLSQSCALNMPAYASTSPRPDSTGSPNNQNNADMSRLRGPLNSSQMQKPAVPQQRLQRLQPQELKTDSASEQDLNMPVPSELRPNESEQSTADDAFTVPGITTIDDTNPDRVTITQPPLSALITINKDVDPLRLESEGLRPMALQEVAREAIANNLDLSISTVDERISRTTFWSSMGKFLPDISLSYQYNFLKGKANVPFGQTAESLNFDNPLIITSAGFKYFGYRGGSVLFGALQNRNRLKASRHARKQSLSDTLQQAAKLYYDLLLAEAFLQIRVQAVETSVSNLKLSQDLKDGGKATKLEVLQAETQLSQDRQRLIDQQIARREASIRLSEFLNVPQNVDIEPSSKYLQKIRLLSTQMTIAHLLKAAIDERPELKQYEELRLAAKKQIVIASARLQPTFQFTGNVLGIGETLGKSSEIINVPNALAPISLAGATAGGVTPVRRSRQITGLFTIGYAVNWNFEGLGTVDAGNIHKAKLEARRAQLEQYRVLNQVTSEVRRSYLNTLKTERKIDEAIAQVRSATEELKLAKLRYQYGLGRNIDVLRAQQDYTSALLEKAQALVNFNIAQVDLLRDTGLISYNTLTSNVPTQRM